MSGAQIGPGQYVAEGVGVETAEEEKADLRQAQIMPVASNDVAVDPVRAKNQPSLISEATSGLGKMAKKGVDSALQFVAKDLGIPQSFADAGQSLLDQGMDWLGGLFSAEQKEVHNLCTFLEIPDRDPLRRVRNPISLLEALRLALAKVENRLTEAQAKAREPDTVQGVLTLSTLHGRSQAAHPQEEFKTNNTPLATPGDSPVVVARPHHYV